MARLVEKSSRAAASRGGGSIPDFPKFSVAFANNPGAQETNAAIQRWNDLMKRRWVLLDEDLTQRFSIKAGFDDGLISLQAAIEHEQQVRADADSALASDILTLTASFTSSVIALQAQITLEQFVRASADTALSTSISTVSASLGSLSATVSTISTALATVEGYLEARVTLQVAAGDVVTGMTIFSASGPDTNISYVAFQADRFQINTATGTKVQVFSTTASAVKLGDVLTVDLVGQKMFIGTGTYANTNTPFYTDAAGNFSLGDKLTWDGTTLTIASGGVTTVDWNTQVTGRPTELTDGRIAAALSAAGLVISGVHPGINVTTGSAGLYLGADFMGYYNGSAWRTYMDNAGRFYLGGTGGALQWDGSTLAISNTSITGLGALATASSVSWGSQVTGRPTELTDGRITTALNSAGLVISGVKPGIVVTTSGIAGLYLGSDFMGYYNGSAWRTYMDNSGNFYLGGVGGALTWNGSTLAIVGVITSTSGTIGGFTLASSSLTGGSGATTVYLGSLSSAGIIVGDPSALHATIVRNGAPFIAYQLFNSSNILVAQLACVQGGNNAGELLLYNSSGSTGVYLDGQNFLLQFSSDTNLYRSAANTLKTDDSLIVTGTLSAGSFSPSSISTGSITGTSLNLSSGAVTAGNGNFSGAVSCGGNSSLPIYAASGRLYFGAAGVRWFISDGTGDLVTVSTGNYQIKKESSDGWTVKLFDGSSAIEFQASGGQIFGRIAGGGAILLG